MSVEVITGNHAAGFALAAAGEANRTARGVTCGIYPITPQTEIVEYVAKFPFSKGRVVPVESEHSALAVCIGATSTGARAFTATSANGLLYSPPHPCACYPESKQFGFTAMGPAATKPPKAALDAPRLTRGPAYEFAARAEPIAEADNWWTFRGDNARSGHTGSRACRAC